VIVSMLAMSTQLCSPCECAPIASSRTARDAVVHNPATHNTTTTAPATPANTAINAALPSSFRPAAAPEYTPPLPAAPDEPAFASTLVVIVPVATACFTPLTVAGFVTVAICVMPSASDRLTVHCAAWSVLVGSWVYQSARTRPAELVK